MRTLPTPRHVPRNLAKGPVDCAVAVTADSRTWAQRHSAGKARFHCRRAELFSERDIALSPLVLWLEKCPGASSPPQLQHRQLRSSLAHRGGGPRSAASVRQGDSRTRDAQPNRDRNDIRNSLALTHRRDALPTARSGDARRRGSIWQVVAPRTIAPWSSPTPPRRRPAEPWLMRSVMGMGLSICWSIIGSDGGRRWTEANAPRGGAYQFLPPRPRESS